MPWLLNYFRLEPIHLSLSPIYSVTGFFLFTLGLGSYAVQWFFPKTRLKRLYEPVPDFFMAFWRWGCRLSYYAHRVEERSIARLGHGVAFFGLAISGICRFVEEGVALPALGARVLYFVGQCQESLVHAPLGKRIAWALFFSLMLWIMGLYVTDSL